MHIHLHTRGAFHKAGLLNSLNNCRVKPRTFSNQVRVPDFGSFLVLLSNLTSWNRPLDTKGHLCDKPAGNPFHWKTVPLHDPWQLSSTLVGLLMNVIVGRSQKVTWECEAAQAAMGTGLGLHLKLPEERGVNPGISPTWATFELCASKNVPRGQRQR